MTLIDYLRCEHKKMAEILLDQDTCINEMDDVPIVNSGKDSNIWCLEIYKKYLPYSIDEVTYSTYHLKKILEKHFWDPIVISRQHGQSQSNVFSSDNGGCYVTKNFPTCFLVWYGVLKQVRHKENVVLFQIYIYLGYV